MLGLYYLALLRVVVPVLVVKELPLPQEVVPVLVVEEPALLQEVDPVLVVEEPALPQEVVRALEGRQGELYLALLQMGHLVQFLNRRQFVNVCA